MTDTPPTAAGELRAAASDLRSQAERGLEEGYAPQIPAEATAALADWLDYEADLASRLPGSVLRSRNHRALAVARAVLGATDRSGR